MACCQLGVFIQAMVINMTSLLFIPLREAFGLTFEQIGRLVLINFITQMVVDLACVALGSRLPVKALVVVANLMAALGLVIFARAPFLLENPYVGLVAGTGVILFGATPNRPVTRFPTPTRRGTLVKPAVRPSPLSI